MMMCGLLFVVCSALLMIVVSCSLVDVRRLLPVLVLSLPLLIVLVYFSLLVVRCSFPLFWFGMACESVFVIACWSALLVACLALRFDVCSFVLLPFGHRQVSCCLLLLVVVVVVVLWLLFGVSLYLLTCVVYCCMLGFVFLCVCVVLRCASTLMGWCLLYVVVVCNVLSCVVVLVFPLVA